MKNLIKGETTIHGRIEHIGGADPKIVFRDHTDNKIYLETTGKLAKQLASRLYKEVALTGVATWDKKTYRVLNFKVRSITDLDVRSLTETFTEIQELFGHNWEKNVER